MKIQKWNNQNLRLIWGIFDEDSYQEYEAWREENRDSINDPDGNGEEEYLHHQQVQLDMSAPQGCPDGTFPILHRDLAEGRSEGVIVLDGQFIPENIRRTVAEAICNSHGETMDEQSANGRIFIEKFLWHQDHGIIEVQTGR